MDLGIDIGGTTAKLALVDDQGTITARDECWLAFDRYATPIQNTVLQHAAAFLREHKVGVNGIGISATGLIDSRTGIVVGANGRIPGWDGCPIGPMFQDEFGVPVKAMNDANAAALAEWKLGSGRGCSNLVMITIGTGVGGGIVVNNCLLEGSHGLAGEIGHMTLYQNGPVCSCGKRGCYENYASMTRLKSLAKAAVGTPLTGKAIFQMARQKNPAILSAMERWTDDIASGAAGLVHLFNPERVIIGGGASTQQELLIDVLDRKINAGVMPRFADGLSVVGAALGNDAGLLGAVYALRVSQENAASGQ